MLSTSAETEHSSIGEYLRRTRINLGIDIATVTDQTKISVKILHAIEESDFTALPAEAFTRGFYALYAKNLSLDPDAVLQTYTEERHQQNKSKKNLIPPPTKMVQDVNNMAERPTFMPFSFLGLILLLLLFFGGFLCWYFSWNPATYLSQKLRSLDKAQTVEQVSMNRTAPGISESKVTFTQFKSPWPKHLDLFKLSYPSTATAAITQERRKSRPPTPLDNPKTDKGPTVPNLPEDLQQ